MPLSIVQGDATQCGPARLSIFSCAFFMRSMEQPRHSRGERILGSSSVKDGRFVARMRILMLGTSLLPGQASRGGAIGISDAMSHRRCARELATLRNFLANGGRCESVGRRRNSMRNSRDPGIALYGRPTDGGRRIATPERQMGRADLAEFTARYQRCR